MENTFSFGVRIFLKCIIFIHHWRPSFVADNCSAVKLVLQASLFAQNFFSCIPLPTHYMKEVIILKAIVCAPLV
jgi:hypothetical protein